MNWSLTLLSFLSCFFNPQPEVTDTPNILWIVSEDNSPLLGCYGDTFATTPNLDRLAEDAMAFDHAFASAPVCAPSRFTIITGTYASAMGTAGMRSYYHIDPAVRFFPNYLREAGYYCTNRSKTDYNTLNQPDTWHASSKSAHYSDRQKGNPFFHVHNIGISHESQVHNRKEPLVHDPGKVPLPPYHPDTDTIRRDWAQYYDRVMQMDEQVGQVIAQLKADGLYDETIIFYYSDHGGALPRGKRFLYESGTHIPLLVRVPEKYRDLFPGYAPGQRTERMVSFVDFAPTVLSLAGIKPPEHMQGKAFMGPFATAPKPAIFNFKERMDATLDFGRAVRTPRYRYIRNFMPYRPNGQHVNYQWRAPSQRSWEEACRNNRCNPVQNRFWQPKASEELYLISADPHNINNLADQPDYSATRDSLSQQLNEWMIQTRDLGLVPELLRNESANIDWRVRVTHPDYPYTRLLEVAKAASSWQAEPVDSLRSWLDLSQSFRYWALQAIRCSPGPEHKSLLPKLEELAADTESPVHLALIGAFYQLGAKDRAFELFESWLAHEDPMVRAYAIDQALIFTPEELEAFRSELEVIADQKERPYDKRAAQYVLYKMNNHEN
jgi:arylsulfatase A-like enzyme